jgi:hypothetical protein
MEGTHPLNHLFQGKVMDPEALDWLSSHNVDFVLFRGNDFDHVLPSIGALSGPPFSVVYSSSRNRELLCSFKNQK